MANWNSSELQTPEPIKKIGQNAQNVINNLEILMGLVKAGADVAKLFLLLSNPAGAIIKLAANEIIKLCNDFKEIGVFYMFINPNDEGYGGQTSREFGLAIKQDKNGLYQFTPSKRPEFGLDFVNVEYQKSLDIADLTSAYKDSRGRNKNDPKFDPPMPIFDNPPIWELGGYDPATWTGHAPVTTIPLANGIFPPEMKPSKVLQIMSESFDDEGDVSTFEVIISQRDNALANPVYTASGDKVDKNTFNPKRLQTEALFLQSIKYTHHSEGPKTRQLMERRPITNRVQSGKPNFAGSSNIQGVEVVAVVALVGVESYQKFVDAFKSLSGLFGGMPSLTEFYDDIAAIYEKATTPPAEPMTIMNDTEWGTFEASTDAKESFIIGEKSNAKAKITKIVKTEAYQAKKIKTKVVQIPATGTELYGDTAVFTSLVDDNEAGNLIKMEILVELYGTETFFPGETIFEGVKTPLVPASQHGPELPGKIIIKAAEGSAINPNIPYNQVKKEDVASYGKILQLQILFIQIGHPLK